MKNFLKRFDRTPKIILYVTSDGTTETPHRIECPANRVDKFLTRPDIVAWRADYRHSFDWHSDNWHEGGV